jgi:hypothetical protein
MSEPRVLIPGRRRHRLSELVGLALFVLFVAAIAGLGVLIAVAVVEAVR